MDGLLQSRLSISVGRAESSYRLFTHVKCESFDYVTSRGPLLYKKLKFDFVRVLLSLNLPVSHDFMLSAWNLYLDLLFLFCFIVYINLATILLYPSKLAPENTDVIYQL